MSNRKALKIAVSTGLVALGAFSPLAMISPANAASGLCAAKSDYADEDWITSLQLGPSNSVTGAQGETYQDQTASSLGTFAAGSTGNQISVVVNVDMNQNPTDNWDENVYIWLDLNQDGEVDLTTEQIFAETEQTDNFTVPDPTNFPNAKTHTYTGTFAMPADAYNGTAIGRAMLQFVPPEQDPILCNDDPNAYDPGISAFEAGTVIDFKVDVTGGVDNPATVEKEALANTGSEAQITAVFGGALVIAGATAVAVTRRRKKSL